jgi:hypothetical protein
VWLSLLATAPLSLSVTLAGFVVVGHALDRYQDRGGRYVALIVFGYLLLLIAVSAGTSYVSPEPLPHVALTVRDEMAQTEGTLLVSTGEAWYLTRRPEMYISVPRTRVTSAVVRSRKRENEPRPPLVLVWDWVRGK